MPELQTCSMEDLMELGAPPVKKTRKRKVAEVVEVAEVTPEPVVEKKKRTKKAPVVEETPIVEKKKRTPKVKAEPIEKKKRVRQSKALPMIVEEPAVEKKKRVKKPKVDVETELTPDAAQAYPSPTSSAEKKRSRTKKEDVPEFFKSYVKGVKEEEAQQPQPDGQKRRPKKQVRIAAEKEAEELWQKPVIRARANLEVNNHMQRMYGMIFKGRQFK